MILRIYFLSFLLAVSFFVSAQIDYPEGKVSDYINRFRHIAVQNMIEYKIPASIIMGQALLESGYGSSPLAVKANNHFGIKCKPEWRGPTYHYNDDKPHECFRSYPSAEASFQDHALFLANRIYYKSLFFLNPSDYKSWAKGLKKAGYATNPQYAQCLISIIERYGLQQLDKDALSIIVLNEQKKVKDLALLSSRGFDLDIPIVYLNFRPFELLTFNQALDFNCTSFVEVNFVEEVSANECLDIAISVAYLKEEEE